MNVTAFLTRTSHNLRGIDEDAPVFGDDEATYWLETLNRVKDDLYDNVSQDWRNIFVVDSPNEPGTGATTATTTLTGTSTFFTDYRVGDKITVSGETERTIATIASDTSLTVTVAFSNTASGKTFTHKNIIATAVTSYSLHRSFLALSGQNVGTNGVGTSIYVNQTNGNRTDLQVTIAQERSLDSQGVFIASRDPQKLYFSNTILSTDLMVGGTLVVPGYYLPDDLTAASDILPFLSPDWACMAVAAEIAFNDITYESKAPDLNAKANDLFKNMVNKNTKLGFNVPKTTPYNVKRIRDTRTGIA